MPGNKIIRSSSITVVCLCYRDDVCHHVTSPPPLPPKRRSHNRSSSSTAPTSIYSASSNTPPSSRNGSLVRVSKDSSLSSSHDSRICLTPHGSTELLASSPRCSGSSNDTRSYARPSPLPATPHGSSELLGSRNTNGSGSSSTVSPLPDHHQHLSSSNGGYRGSHNGLDTSSDSCRLSTASTTNTTSSPSQISPASSLDSFNVQQDPLR